MKHKLDPTELLFCTLCGHDYEADPNDLGTYVCPCGRKNKNIDAALRKLGKKYPQKDKNKIREDDPKQ